MRKLTFATAAALACAAFPATAQNGQRPPKAEPPRDAQIAPCAPSVADCPSAEKVLTAPPAAANIPPGPPNRFTFNRVDDGFLRLDIQTGQVAFCSPHAVGWACQTVPEDRAALEKEIARLQDEAASLKQEIAALRTPPSPRPPDDLTPPSAGKSENTARLREDLARARVALENAWRRLVEMIVNFQKDMMSKG